MPSAPPSLLLNDDPSQINEIFARGPDATRNLPPDLLMECARANAPRCLQALLDNGYHTYAWWTFGVGVMKGQMRETFLKIYESSGVRLGLGMGVKELLDDENYGEVSRLLIEGHIDKLSLDLKSGFGVDFIKTALTLGGSLSISNSSYTDVPILANQLLALAHRHRSGGLGKHPTAHRIIMSMESSVKPDTEAYGIFHAYQAAQIEIAPGYRNLCLARALSLSTSESPFVHHLLPTLRTGTWWANALVGGGLATDTLNAQGNTLVDCAIQRGDLEGAKAYLAAGAKLTGTFDRPSNSQATHSTGKARITPLLLQIADEGTRLMAVEMFPELAHERARDGSTVLMRSTYHCKSLPKALINAGADVHAVDRAGATALHHAASAVFEITSMRPNVIEDLLAAGTDPTHVDRMGFTAAELLDRLIQGTSGPSPAHKEASGLLYRAARQANLKSAIAKGESPDRGADGRRLDVL